MKKFLLIIVIAVCPGCLMEMLTVTAIQGELAAQNASSATRALSSAKDSKAEIELRNAVQVYQAEKGYYPGSLQELVPQYLPALPMQSNGQPFGYNSATGEVFSGVQRSAPVAAVPLTMTQGDHQNVEYLRGLVYQYWQTTGTYPDSMNALVPGYTTSLPTMSNGQPFPYNAQSGMVYHPAEMAPAPTGAVTGHQYAAPSGNDPVSISDEHTQRQLNVMNQLGL